MSSRHRYSKTWLGTATIAAQRPYDEYRRDSEGGNSPRVNGRRIFTENGYTCDISFDRNPPCQFSSSPTGPWSNASMFPLGAKPEPAETLDYPTAYEVLPRLREKWRQSEFNIGVAAGESKETLKMMTDRIGSIARAARAMRKGNLQDALRHMTGQVPRDASRRAATALNLGDVTGAWLETNLGWSPTLSEIYNLSEHVKFVPQNNRIRAAIVKPLTARAASYTDPAFQCTGGGTYGTSVIVDVYRNPTIAERLGLRDPAGVVWELATLSFLVDYFVPIGNSIANAMSVSELPVQKVIVTRFYKFEGRTRLVGNYAGGLYVKQVKSPTNVAIHKQYTMERAIGGTIHDVISTLAWAPDIVAPKVDLSTRQLLTTAALATEALRKLVGLR